MRELLWKRIILKNKQNVLKKSAFCFSFFMIVLIFILFMLIIVENEVGEYWDSKFDIMLFDFDGSNISELEMMPNIDEIYASRIIMLDLEKEGNAQNIDVYLVDHWDKSGISYLGDGRCEYGKIDESLENGIILDVLTARKLNASVGDKVYLVFNDKKLEYKVVMLIRPDFFQPSGTAVCLYNSYFLDTLYEQYGDEDLDYSILFVKTKDGNVDYFYSEYEGPSLAGVNDKDKIIMRAQMSESRQLLIKKAIENLIYTPPVIIAICFLGTALLCVFVWREYSLLFNENENLMRILWCFGYDPRKIVLFLGVYLLGMVVLSIALAGVIVKILIYDRIINSYYLAWRTLLWAEIGGISILWVIVLIVYVIKINFGVKNLNDKKV